MRVHAILLFAAPMLSFAQAPPAATPPPEVDQALRTRATAFFQYQKDGNFRKAYDLVAEDSKDYYFSAPKQKGFPFTIDDIQYTPDFSMATVKAIMNQPMGLAGQQVVVPSVQSSQWKLEKGEWMWYHDPATETVLTIVGQFPIGPAPAAPAESKPSPLPKDLSPQAVAAAAAKLTPKATIDKRSLAFILGKEGTEQITFRNNNTGQIRVSVGVIGDTDSVTVDPKTALLNPQAEFPVTVKYNPAKDVLSRTVIEFVVDPFGSTYMVPVTAARDSSAVRP